MQTRQILGRSGAAAANGAEGQSRPGRLPGPVGPEISEREQDERPGAEEETLLKEFEERRSLQKSTELTLDAELEGSEETENSSSQELLFELRKLTQKFNKENHPSRKPEESPLGTVLHVERGKPAPEANPLWLQRPTRVAHLGQEQHFQNKEHPRPMLETQRSERNPDVQPDICEGRQMRQLPDLQDLLTAGSPPGKSLAVSISVEEERKEQRRREERANTDNKGSIFCG